MILGSQRSSLTAAGLRLLRLLPRSQKRAHGVLARRHSASRSSDSWTSQRLLMPRARMQSTAQESPQDGEAEDSKAIERPNTQQLHQLFVASAIPFVGFGFFDNFVMIVAGDMIDNTVCVAFCLSTMAAAAVGNAVSDVAGIYAGGLVEQAADRAGIREPPLSSEQKMLPSTKIWQYTGQVVGILFGCLLGACPLLFIDLKESTRAKRQKELQTALDEAMPDVQRIMKAEAVLLMTLDEKSQELVCLSATSNLSNVQPWNVEKGIMGHVARTGCFVNTADVSESPLRAAPEERPLRGCDLGVRNILCVPLLSGTKVVGVLAAINRENGGAFNAKDEDNLSFIASHMCVRMEEIAIDGERSFKDNVLSCEKVMYKQESFEYGSTARQRRAELYLPALAGITQVLQAQATTLMLLDNEGAELYTEAIYGDLPKHKTTLGEGIAGRCASQGRILNVRRMEDDAGEFDSARHDDYLGTGMTVWSELCVPLFDSARKCLGVVKIINKQGGQAFDEEDADFATEVAKNLGIMLEDDGGIKRVLALTRRQNQKRALTTASKADHNTVLFHLEKGQNLPCSAGPHEKSITQFFSMNPYVTVRIVRGNPMENPDMEVSMAKARKNDRVELIRKFSKSKIVPDSLDPSWEETFAVTVPIELRGVPQEELYAHVLLWHNDSVRDDVLVGQALFNLSSMPIEKLGAAQPCHLLNIPGVDPYDLDKTMLWLSFSRGPKPLAPAIKPDLDAVGQGDDWVGETYVPLVGQTALEDFQRSDNWLQIVESLRDSLTNSCGVSFEEFDQTKMYSSSGPIVCAVSDPEKLDCPLIYISKGFEELFGYPRSFALGRNCRFLQPNNRKENDMTNLADRERMQRFVQGLMPEGYVLWNLLLNETYSGRKFWNVLRMEFVYLGEERKPYIFAVQREFAKPPRGLTEVAAMRDKLAEHEKQGTLPTDVLAWAGLSLVDKVQRRYSE